MRWASIALFGFLTLLLTAVAAGSLLARAGLRPAIRLHEILERERLAPTPDQLDRSDLQFDGFDRVAEFTDGPHGRRNQLDLYLPRDAVRPLPVIVFIHGGANKIGKDDNAPSGLCIPLLARGYAVAQINYCAFYKPPGSSNPRSDPSQPFPAQIQDCKAAIRFLKATAETHGLDPERIGVLGHSFGGYLAALVGTTGDTGEFDREGWHTGASGAVNAVCVIGGPTHLMAYMPQTELHRDAQGYAFPTNSMMSAIQQFYIDGMTAEEAAKASPVTYVSSGDPPFLILHGFEDVTVAPHQADLLYVKLRKAGVPAHLMIVPGAGHYGPALFNKQNRGRIADFFDDHLKQ